MQKDNSQKNSNSRFYYHIYETINYINESSKPVRNQFKNIYPSE